ncbi:Hsp20/alpha crystallin family protein [Akkermansiaceae bacterium]|nr:Hsp20/alpha crystallin family protein [Akkermansiaceae bacterium]
MLLPGVAKDTLSVNVADRHLSLNAERRYQNSYEDRDYKLQVPLHEDLDPGNHQAKHGDGILTLKLIKRKELAPCKIDILSN